MSDYRFYFIPRTDMASMTPGRMMAQCSHGSHQIFKDIEEWEAINSKAYPIQKFDEWRTEAHGFGTAIILSPNENIDQVTDFQNMKMCFERNEYVMCNIVVDPEYFVKDGDTVHIVPNVVTGIYFFGTKEILETHGKYNLFTKGFENG